MPWSDRFRHPIPLPGGGEIATLIEARDYILKLSESERVCAPWNDINDDIKRAALEYGPWMDFARIGFMRALYSPEKRVCGPPLSVRRPGP